MKLYKSLAAFAGALATVFAVAYVTALLDAPGGAYIASLRLPAFAPTEMSGDILGMCACALIILCATVALRRPPLRFGLVYLALTLALQPLAAAAFYIWKLPYLSLSCLLLQATSVAFFLNDSIKKTKELWLAVIPLMAWYIYLFLVNYAVILMN